VENRNSKIEENPGRTKRRRLKIRATRGRATRD
jgi:hypothetical protein